MYKEWKSFVNEDSTKFLMTCVRAFERAITCCDASSFNANTLYINMIFITLSYFTIYGQLIYAFYNIVLNNPSLIYY